VKSPTHQTLQKNNSSHHHQRKSAKKQSVPDFSRHPSFQSTLVNAAPGHSGRLTPQSINFLQRTIGNQAVTNLIQKKLKIGRPGDRYEQEADRVVDAVTNDNASGSNANIAQIITPIQGKELEGEEELQTKRSIQRQTEEEEPLQAQEEEEDLQAGQRLQKQVTEPEEETIQTGSFLQHQSDFEEEEPVQTAHKSAEEEEPIQTLPDIRIQQQADEEELQTKALIQHQTDEEDFVQSSSFLQRQTEEEEPIMAKATGASLNHTQTIEDRLSAGKTGGEALPEDIRAIMEQRFDTDFTDVRIHADSNAAQMNAELGSKAFTHGKHIYFGEGEYNPGSNSGKRLIAHELTHTIQQNEEIKNNLIQKNGAAENEGQTLSTGIVDEGSKTIRFESLALPPFKASHPSYQGELRRPKGYRRIVELGKPQRDWKMAMGPPSKPTVRPIMENIIRQSSVGTRSDQSGTVQVNDSIIFAFNTYGTGRHKNRFAIGTIPQIVNELSSPTWNNAGNPTLYHVDHIKELQLGGEDNLNNMHLIKAGINRSSGFSINNRIHQKVRAYLDSQGIERTNANRDEILNNYDLIFNRAIPDRAPRGFQNFNAATDIWQREDIQSGDHFQNAKINEILEVRSLSSLGDQENFLVFPGEAGWIPKPFRKNDRVYAAEKRWLDPWEITGKTFGDEAGNAYLRGLTIKLDESGLSGRARIKYQPQAERTVIVTRYPGALSAGYVDKDSIKQEAINVKGLSPIQLDNFDVTSDKGVYAHGQLLPSVPFIGDIGLEFKLEEGAFSIYKQFNSGELNVPPPFTISNSSLILSASSIEGFGISGQVDFGINNVGEGYLGAAATTSGGFDLEGQFNFDSKLFEPASVKVEYKDNVFGVEGTIGIPRGKVRGVKSATITASYSEGNFSARGNAELDVPGVERSEMSASYSEDEFSIGGSFQLSNDIPGIRGGSVEANVRKVEGEEDYQVSVTGTAQPDIPGVDTTLTIGYESGIITIEGSADYSRGMLAGRLQVGATNRPIGEDGQPAGEPDDDMRVYGGGELTLQIAPWLEATAGVRLTPEGEIEVRGEIGLPSSLEIFPRKSIETTIFRMPTLEIPIFAIPLGPRSIGIVATIGGGLEAQAGIGPGEITDLRIGITYNPAHEEQTTISGAGRFVIPADAGLRLYARAGIGLSVAIARVSGNIEVGGALGIEGAAEASVNIEWSPAAGLELNALGQIYAQPKFTFDVSAVLEASALFLSKEWRKTLAQFEYGPDLRFGIKFPVHYVEGEPFDISLDDVEFEAPEIDIAEFVKGLGRRAIE
jgi:hypothetical protein